MSAPERTLPQLIEEAQRVLAICNACRYCEGYCATFPALQRRLSFTEGDIRYLGNLCHNCGACLYACQYAPPHEFALNFPRLMAQVRAESWQRYAWPGFLARAFESNGLFASLATAAGLVFFLLFAAWLAGPERLFAAHSDAQGSFYAVIPHGAMVAVFGAVSLFVLAAFAVGFVRFWRDTGERDSAFTPGPALGAVRDAVVLRYLDGGGDGCTYPDEKPSFARRTFHHLTFYGFLLCFAATSTATIYHYALDWKAPYPFWSLPVLLGTVGGVGLLAGPAGLAWLKRRRDPELADPAQRGMEAGFLALLFLTSLTGLALLAFRETVAMGMLLVAHLGVVLALFATMPYGKFVHALYRLAALARFHLERRRPPEHTAPE
ncbi:MAG: tricarballylate utilization 4Fe-4S protein TcuB [Burkholderiales bacterium]|nr:tricarballylate utilization 4Fe-4S protein TcuB [Burkholderiales bacterium]MBZ0251448.1 tricarballylate utilization 4Fe-4S protein TcuB [Burkholderiales bacterium]